MPIEDEDDLFNEEFDLVDDDDEFGTDVDESDVDETEDEITEDDVRSEADDDVEADFREDDADDDVEDSSEESLNEETKERGREAVNEAGGSKKPRGRTGKSRRRTSDREADAQPDEGVESSEATEDLDEYGRPKPAPNYVVHIYEHQKFQRTIERPFTPEDAEAFASEYNRTGKVYGRLAMAGKNDAKPKKSLD